MKYDFKVYNYKDYRELLRDWFWSTKENNPKVSFRYIARQLGLKSPNHFQLVINKKRHLSLEVFKKTLTLLKPSHREEQYIKLLFKTAHEKDSAKTEELSEQIDLQQQQFLKEDLALEQYELVGNTLAWYISMAAITFDGKSTADISKLIKDNCLFPVDAQQIEQAFKLLVKMKSIVIVDNVCKFDFENIITKWDFDHSEIKKHHLNTLKLASQTIAWPIKKRFFSSVTIPCDPELHETMIQEIRTLCLKLLKQSNNHAFSEEKNLKVMTLHFSLFPYFDFN